MKRSPRLVGWALVGLLGVGLGAPAQAQQSQPMRHSYEDPQGRIATVDGIREDLPNGTTVIKNTSGQVVRQFPTDSWKGSEPVPAPTRTATGGFTGRVNDIRNQIYSDRLSQIENDPKLSDAQRLEAMRELEQDYRSEVSGNPKKEEPGFLSKVGEKLFGVATSVAGEVLKRMISGNATNEDRELLSRAIAERDAALRERLNPAGAGNGANAYGQPIYDSNGNIIGWDRDGDNQPDLADANRDGTPDSWNGGTYKDSYEDFAAASEPKEIYSNGRLAGYDTNGDGIVDIPVPSAPPPVANSSGGGAGGAGTIGGSLGDGNGAGEETAKDDEEEGDDEETAKKDDEEEGDEEGSDEEEATADKGKGKRGKRPVTGSSDPQAALALTRVTGRMLVLPKPQLGMPAQGNVRPGQPGQQDPWGWGNRPGGQNGNAPADPWNDADNGDRQSDDPWAEEILKDDFNDQAWNKARAGGQPQTRPGQPQTRPGTQPGYGQQPGYPSARPGDELFDEVVRVETVIAEWRAEEAKRQLRATDPYGVQEGGAQGFQQPTDPYGRPIDPLAQYRTEDGLLDLNRVDIWIVADDALGTPSWKEGSMPRRFKVTMTQEALATFTPIQGGYVVVRGTMTEVPVNPELLMQVQGEIKQLTVAQWLGTSAQPPMGGQGQQPGAPGARNGGDPYGFDDY